MKPFFISLSILFISSLASAQNSLKVVVTQNSNKAPVSAATIYLRELNRTAITDAQGVCDLKDLPKGHITLKITHLGNQPCLVDMTLTKAADTLTVALSQSAVEINEVVVSGAYPSLQNSDPLHIDVIDRKDLLANGYSTIMDAISAVPGVAGITTGPLVSRPVIRGLAGNRVLTVVDGVRFETQQWDEEHGIGVNELGMDKIEIIKGPASLLYGPEAMGGVVHLIEENPAAAGHINGNVFGSCASNNLGFIAGGSIKGATDKMNWSLNLLGKMLPDYYFSGYDFRAPNTRMNEAGVSGSVGFNRAWGSTTLSYKFNQAYYGILDGKDIVKDASGKLVNKDTAEVDMFPSEIEAPYHSVTDHKIASQTTFIAGRSTVKLALGLQSNERTEFEDNGTKEGYNYVDMSLLSATYDLKWYMPEVNHFSTVIGVGGMFQNNSNNTEARTVLVPDATINDLGFVAFEKYTKGHLSVTGGIRYDMRSLSTDKMVKDSAVNMPGISRDYSNASWALGAVYQAGKHLLLKANFATGYRTPNLNELMSDGLKLESQHVEIGNPDFVKEQNAEVDLSAAYNAANFSVEASWYNNMISNFIYLTPRGDSAYSVITSSRMPVYQFLQHDATITGMEFGLSIHPTGLKWLEYSIRGAHLVGKRSDNDSYLPMMPSDKIYNTLIVHLTDRGPWRTMNARIGTITAMDQKNVALAETTTDGYTILNAGFSLTRTIWKLQDISFMLSINNLLDTQYFDNLSRLRNYGVYNPGRNIVLGIQIPFAVK